jgi:HD domain
MQVIGTMNRRSLLTTLGAYLCGLMGQHSGQLIPAVSQTSEGKLSASVIARSVAGVRIVDTKIARAATDLSQSVCPPYLFNHAMRTFLYGSLVGRALGQRYDEETLYLACILHDLGLTERFAGDLPFEIQGAEAAKRFLSEQGYAQAHAEIVWDGIAMHASAISGFKRSEIALVGEGAGADVLGPDFSQVKKADSDAILQAFPRLKFKDAFIKTCVEIIQKHPRGASRSFMRDIGERYVPSYHPRNFCDLVAQAPFDE